MVFNCPVMYKMWMDLDKCVYHTTIKQLQKILQNYEQPLHRREPLAGFFNIHYPLYLITITLSYKTIPVWDSTCNRMEKFEVE